MIGHLLKLQHDRRRVLIRAELALPKSRQKHAAFPLTLSVQSASLELGGLEDVLEQVDARSERDVGKVVVTADAGGGDGPEDEEVHRQRVEEGEKMLVERRGDGGELSSEMCVAKAGVGLKDRSEQGRGVGVDRGSFLCDEE